MDPRSAMGCGARRKAFGSRLCAWFGAGVLASAGAAPDVRAQGDDEAGERGRRELAELVRRSFDEVEAPQNATVDGALLAFGLELHAAEGSGARAFATSGEEESKNVLRAMGAARALFVHLTGQAVDFPPGCSVFLLEQARHKQAFLERHPSVTAESRVRLEKLEGSGIPGTADWAFWDGDAERRVDGMVRFSLDWFFKRGYGVTLEQHAWLHEGLGLYLTHALVGTRRTWFVPPRTESSKQNGPLAELASRLREPYTDWLAEARGLFDAEHKFDLEELLHLEARELGPEEYLRVHALAAYLVEIHRDALPALLRRVGAGDDPRAVLEEVSGLALKALRPRLDRWLDERERWIARAEGRRTEEELSALWKGLDGKQKRAALADFRQRLDGLDTAQMRALRALLAGAPAQLATPAAAPFFDPMVHAPAQPIPRKRLSGADSRAKKLLKEARREPDPRAAILAYSLDWASGAVVRHGDPEHIETVFHNARLGLPPGADLARALVLRALLHPEEAVLRSAFAHAYSDRDGNVYPLTLYDLWSSGAVIEMPDVDALGIVHEVMNEWKRWVAPVPPAQQSGLYTVLEGLFLHCRRSRELRETCADLLLAPQPAAREGYGALLSNLQALWASQGSDPARLAQVLPDGKQWEGFLKELVDRCKQDPELYAQGRRRAAELRRDAEAVKSALGAALEEAGRAEETPVR